MLALDKTRNMQPHDQRKIERKGNYSVIIFYCDALKQRYYVTQITLISNYLTKIWARWYISKRGYYNKLIYMNLMRNFLVTFPYQYILIYIYKWLSKYIEKCYFAAIKIKKSVKSIIKKTCMKRDKICVKKHLSQDFIEKSSKMQHSDRYNTTQASLPHVHSSSLKKTWNGIIAELNQKMINHK